MNERNNHPLQRCEITDTNNRINTAHSPQLFQDPECWFGRESNPGPTAPIVHTQTPCGPEFPNEMKNRSAMRPCVVYQSAVRH